MQDFDSNQNYNSNQLKDNSNFYVENNFSSINSRFFKNDEFNSVQNDFNYNVQMGFTYKISSMIKNCSNSQNSDHLTFLTSRMQEFGTYDDQSFIFNFPPTKNKINWLSPKEFISESFSLFPKDSNGIFLPSEYNNNSFLSAINLLMRNPSLLSRLFETEHVNEAGIYGVWLCDYGIWRLVTVDDKVPTFQSNYLLNEFHCKEKCIFHMILAKALAKFHKGYEKLANMNIISILNYLTGSQSEQKNLCELQAIDDIWVLIKKWREANYLIFFQNNPTEVQLQQIEESPCYSIIDCFELIPTNENENLEQIICLKSPIKGGAILNGKFNKNTNLSYDIKKRLNFNAKHDNDDSIFYLTIEEILKCFTDIGVCKAQSKINDVYHWRTVKNSENFIVKCPLESSGNAIFSLHQKEDSYNSGSNSHYIRVLLAKETGINSKDDNLQFLGGDYSSKNIFIEKNNVESGDYIMVVEVLWADGIDKEITIGCLCENENMNQNFNFEVIQKKNSEILELQKNLIKVYAKSKESKTMRIRDYTASNEPSIKIYNDMVFGFSYFYYINQSTMKLREVITMQVLKNLMICEPFKDNYSFEIQLDPNEEMIVLYKYEMSGKDFSYALTIKASLERANSIVSSSQIKYEGAESKMNVSKMKNSSIMLFEQNPKDELLKLIKEKGKISKRIWKNQEIDVLVHSFIHKEGVSLLYCNNTKNIFKEIVHLNEMKNLKLSNKEIGKLKEIEIFLEPGKCEMLLFNKVKNEEFQFRFKNIYTII